MLSFSRMSWGCREGAALPPIPGSTTGRWAHVPNMGRWAVPWVPPGAQGPPPGLGDPPGTCRLPRGQYSVRMQMFGGSVQAPTKRVRCSFWTSRIWGAVRRVWGSAPLRGPPALPSPTYVLQLEQDLARQLDPLAVEVLDGHQVALRTGGAVGARWGGGPRPHSRVPIPYNTPSWRRPGTAPLLSSASRSWSLSGG